jgi:hypothetical protein
MRYVVYMGDSRNSYRDLVGKAEGKITIGKHTYRWNGNIKMNYKEVGWEGMDQSM